MDPSQSNARPKEKEWNGPAWKHPYMLYILATLVLFFFLLTMGYLAVENEWIPSRGINRSSPGPGSP